MKEQCFRCTACGKGCYGWLPLTLDDALANAAMNPVAGSFIVSFSSFLRLHKKEDLVAFAKKQYPILKEFKDKTAGDPALSEYHGFYQEAAEELSWFASRP